MLRSAVGNSSNELNEVSVSSQGAEHLQASDSSHSAEQPLLEVSVEQNRQSDSVALYRIICTCSVCTYTYTRYMAYRTLYLDLVYT